MPAQLLFFGATADIAGTRLIEIDVYPGTTVDVVLRDMVERFPEMSSHKLKMSINQQFATGDQLISDNDELAIFTPVSGG